MMLHKNAYAAENIFPTMSGPLVNSPMEKWLELIRRETYQAATEDRMWPYEPVSYFWPDIDHAS